MFDPHLHDARLEMKSLWSLEPGVVHLNHGSFGACPNVIRHKQRELQDRMERDLMQFFVYDLRHLLDEARLALANFLASSPRELAFVSNATAAVNAVVRSFPFKSGDEVLTTDHCYNGCHNVLRFVAEQRDLKVVVAEIPLPVASREQVLEAVLSKVTPATRLALIDHVTSPTAIVMPIRQLVNELESRDVRCMVDGAHAVGMVPLHLDELGASFYTSNLHKWMCAPKGCAFLHAKEEHHDWLVPSVVSHGLNIVPPGSSRFHALFDWTGTVDPTPWLCVPAVLNFWEETVAGGILRASAANRELLLEAVKLLNDRIGATAVCPEVMVGTIASLRLPDRFGNVTRDRIQTPGAGPTHISAVQSRLHTDYGIHVPVVDWKQQMLLVRISSHCYNVREDYQALTSAIMKMLPR